jgi:hypothetical protein
MTDEAPAYGLWGLVLINSLVFVLFAYSFFKPRTPRRWADGLPRRCAGRDRQRTAASFRATAYARPHPTWPARISPGRRDFRCCDRNTRV